MATNSHRTTTGDPFRRRRGLFRAVPALVAVTVGLGTGAALGVHGGNDIACYTQSHCFGSNNNDDMYGNDQNNIVIGNAGADVLQLFGGNDDGQGSDGQDLLVGYGSGDGLRGGAGPDAWFCGGQECGLNGDDGNDGLYGGLGNDTLRGGNGTEPHYGEEDNDHLHAAEGIKEGDIVVGGGGYDVCWIDNRDSAQNCEQINLVN